MTDAVMLGRSFTRDPHDVLHVLQSEAPVSRGLVWGSVPVWLITRYDDAKALLADPRLTTDRAAALRVLPSNAKGSYASNLTQHMLHSDPPDHTRLRKLVVKAFTARTVELMVPRIGAIADELLDAIDTSRPVDLIEAYAGPLPARVIGELLGVPTGFRDRFQELLDPYVNQSGGPELEAAFTELTAMLTQLLIDKRREPRDDLLSALVQATSDGDRLSETELIATVNLLIGAGYDTTVNLIGNGILALVNNPSQLDRLRAEPALITTAVEELLRIDGPVNITVLRFSIEPIRIGDVVIPENQIVAISLLAANHDASHFDDPDRVDLSRTPNRHLAFGHGIHHCLGAPLARLEGRIALARLLRRFAHLELASREPLEYRHSVLVHGLASLPVRCTA